MTRMPLSEAYSLLDELSRKLDIRDEHGEFTDTSRYEQAIWVAQKSITMWSGLKAILVTSKATGDMLVKEMRKIFECIDDCISNIEGVDDNEGW